MRDRLSAFTMAGLLRRPWGALFLVAVMAVAGGILLTSMIPHGIGLSSDSLLYVTGAESLRSGKGWTQPSGEGTDDPITHFPPIYSLLLATVAGRGGEVLAAASAVAVLLFAAVILAVGWALIFVQRDEIAGVIAAIIVAASPILASIFTWAMSEPLFLLLGLVCLALLVVGIDGNRTGWVVLAGLAAGLAYLTRYIGMALILTGGLVLILKAGWSRRQRVMAIVAFTVPALLLGLAWSYRNFMLTGTATNRTLTWHPLSATKWKAPFGLLWSWLLPSEFDYTALLVTSAVIAGGVLIGVILLPRRWPGVRRAVDRWRHSPSLVVVHAAYAAVYAGILAFSLMFVDAATPVDNRIAAPIYLSFVIVLASAWAIGYRRWPQGWARGLLLLGAISLVVSYVLRTSELERDIRVDGQGFASKDWQASAVIAAAKELPSDTLVYTDNKEVFTFFTGIGAFGLPPERDGVTGLVNPETPVILEQVLERLAESGGAVVLFGGRREGPDRAYLTPLLSNLELLVSVPDGLIYTASGRD